VITDFNNRIFETQTRSIKCNGETRQQLTDST